MLVRYNGCSFQSDFRPQETEQLPPTRGGGTGNARGLCSFSRGREGAPGLRASFRSGGRESIQRLGNRRGFSSWADILLRDTRERGHGGHIGFERPQNRPGQVLRDHWGQEERHAYGTHGVHAGECPRDCLQVAAARRWRVSTVCNGWRGYSPVTKELIPSCFSHLF